MDRDAQITLTANIGSRGSRTFKVGRLEAYHTESAMDTDADAFSVDIGDPNHELDLLLERDVEILAKIYLTNEKGNLTQIFTGLADLTTYSTDDSVLSVAGRDLSCLATDTDAPPGRWKFVRPAKFITKRAHALGIKNVVANKHIHEIGALYTDASETEWEFWYRVARTGDVWIWTGPLGTLYLDKLNYLAKPKYKIGFPVSGSKAGWLQPELVEVTINRQQRIRKSWVYGQHGKKGNSFIAQSLDTSIRNWQKQPVKITTSTVAKNLKQARKEADDEIFESIVGAFEIIVQLRDVGVVVMQNQIAQVSLPDLGISGNFYVVGVQRSASGAGMTQTVRLRQKHFALSRRKPTPPVISDPISDAADKNPGSITSNLGVKWADSFVKATREFKGGWDFATFLGVLLAICDKETGFRNVRASKSGYINDAEWKPFSQWGGPHPSSWESYCDTFANAVENRRSPWHGTSETAVGPMQILTRSYKEWADRQAHSKSIDEYQGGRWDADSNIRSGARALKGKLEMSPPANPADANQIWIGVRRYYGSNSDAANNAYAADVKARFDAKFHAMAQSAVTAATPVGAGSQAIAKKLMAYAARGKCTPHPDIRRCANGQPVYNMAHQQVRLDPRMLGALLSMIEDQGHSLGISAMCSDHNVSTTKGRRSAHPDGRAVDINVIDGTRVDKDNSYARAKTMLLAEDLRALKGQLKPVQLICGGYGNHYDRDIANLCIPSPSYYGSDTLDDHYNHIHLGY